MKEMLWIYFLRLSEHITYDKLSPSQALYLPKPYTDEVATEVEAWDEIVRFLPSQGFNTVLIDLGDGLIYDSHPEIAAPNAWSKAFFRQKLDEMRALGLTPLPKLNFSAGHSTWMKEYRRRTSTPEYYQFCDDLIDEVCELFDHPSLFHLGMDEEYPNNQLWKESILVRNEELFWHDLNLLFSRCERNGARPWVWSDYCWIHPDIFVRRMPRSVLQSNWFYFLMLNEKTAEPAGWETAFRTFQKLEDLGFDQIPTPSTWANKNCTRQTVAHCKTIIAPEHLKGFMTAPWYNTCMDDIYFLKHDAHRMKMAKDIYYPEQK